MGLLLTLCSLSCDVSFPHDTNMQSCNNYRGIKLVSQTMKLWEKVVEAGLRRELRISKQEGDFMPRKEHCRCEVCLTVFMEKRI